MERTPFVVSFLGFAMAAMLLALAFFLVMWGIAHIPAAFEVIMYAGVLGYIGLEKVAVRIGKDIWFILAALGFGVVYFYAHLMISEWWTKRTSRG